MTREEAEILVDLFNGGHYVHADDIDYDLHHRDFIFSDQIREEIGEGCHRIRRCETEDELEIFLASEYYSIR